MCGPSKELKQAYSSALSLSTALQSDFKQIFAGNMNILNALESSLAPTIAGGPGQFGFTPAETAAKRSMATEQLAAAGSQASNAVRGALASEGGGNAFLPSGSQAAIESGLAQEQAYKQAEAQMGITEKGYDVGRQNYFTAIQEAGALPGELENPATNAGNVALGGVKEQEQAGEDITQARNAWIAPVAGMLGAIGGAALGPAGMMGRAATAAAPAPVIGSAAPLVGGGFSQVG